MVRLEIAIDISGCIPRSSSSVAPSRPKVEASVDESRQLKKLLVCSAECGRCTMTAGDPTVAGGAAFEGPREWHGYEANDKTKTALK